MNEVRGNARCDPPEDRILHQDLEKSPVGIRTTKKETEVMKIFRINTKTLQYRQKKMRMRKSLKHYSKCDF